MNEWPALMNLINGPALRSAKLLQWLPSVHLVLLPVILLKLQCPPSHSSLMSLILCPGLSCLLLPGEALNLEDRCGVPSEQGCPCVTNMLSPVVVWE